MPVKIKPLEDSKRFENFAKSYPGWKTFLQSWYWGEFVKRDGSKVWRLGIESQEKLVGTCLVQKVEARRGTFLLVPHGPLIDWHKKTILTALIEKLVDLGRQENCDFIRINPTLEDSPEARRLFKNFGFRRAPLYVHTENFWVLNIKPGEDELLGSMRKVHRYSIRKAARLGVKVKQSADPADIDRFYKLYRQTVQHQHFIPFSRDYIRLQLDTFAPQDLARIFFARLQGKILAAAVIDFWDSGAFYHHGASSREAQVPASHLLQWEAIREARRRGLEWYNFWGIAPEGRKNHPFSGITFFKTGFGGRRVELVPTQDLVLTSRYWLSWGVEKIRRSRRRL